MDLKPIYLLISTLVIAAAITVGWLDARKKRESEVGRSRVGSPPSAEVGPGLSRESEKGSTDGSGREETGTTPEPEDAGPSRAEEERLEQARALLDAQDFARAAAVAGKLSRSSRGSLELEARRIEAKARVFARLLPRSAVAEVQAHEVDIGSRNPLIALRVDEEGDRFRLTLPNGVVLWKAKDDVVDIRPIDSARFLDAEWERMERRIAKLDHPMDIYIRGVRKLYQLGLARQGCELMEKLLRMPGSRTIPLAFGGEDAEELTRLWMVAGDGASRAQTPAKAATTVAVVEPAPRRGDGMEEPAPRRAVDPSPGPSPPPAPAAGEAGALGRARQLMTEARDLYRRSQGKDGGGPDIRRAYDKLRDAQDLLASFAHLSPDARRLNQMLAQLIVDVGKSLPFY